MMLSIVIMRLIMVQLQAGHLTKKNKKCPMYVEPEPEVLEPWIPDVMLGHPMAQVGIITILSPSSMHHFDLTHKPNPHKTPTHVGGYTIRDNPKPQINAWTDASHQARTHDHKKRKTCATVS